MAWYKSARATIYESVWGGVGTRNVSRRNTKCRTKCNANVKITHFRRELSVEHSAYTLVPGHVTVDDKGNSIVN